MSYIVVGYAIGYGLAIVGFILMVFVLIEWLPS